MSFFCTSAVEDTSLPTRRVPALNKVEKKARRRSIYDFPPPVTERETSLYFYSTNSYSTHRLGNPLDLDLEDEIMSPTQSMIWGTSYGDSKLDLDVDYINNINNINNQARQEWRASMLDVSVVRPGRAGTRFSSYTDSSDSDIEKPVVFTITPKMVPVPPPRSRLREAPPPVRNVSDPIRPSVNERLSSLYQLPVDRPLPQPSTPSLSSGSSNDGDADVPVSPESSVTAAKRISHTAEGLVSWGRRRKSGIERDEHRVRDGAEKRKASSGVYTPATFPGPTGPKAAVPASQLYTPKTYTLQPALPLGHPGAPTRSTSVSSSSSSPSDTEYPQTPISPQPTQNRMTVSMAGAGKTMSTFTRRISNQISSLDLRSNSYSTTPTAYNGRDSYFPPSPAEMDIAPPSHSRKSSYAISTPFSSSNNTHAAQVAQAKGLGIGLVEKNGSTITSAPGLTNGQRSRSYTIGAPSPDLDGERRGGMKRKPVPRFPERELTDQMKSLNVEDGVHAL